MMVLKCTRYVRSDRRPHQKRKEVVPETPNTIRNVDNSNCSTAMCYCCCCCTTPAGLFPQVCWRFLLPFILDYFRPTIFQPDKFQFPAPPKRLVYIINAPFSSNLPVLQTCIYTRASDYVLLRCCASGATFGSGIVGLRNRRRKARCVQPARNTHFGARNSVRRSCRRGARKMFEAPIFVCRRRKKRS